MSSSAESQGTSDKAQTPSERKRGHPQYWMAPGEDEETTIYLANFERCLRIIDRPDYANLFTDGERDMVQKFATLSRQARGLYTRMLQRKGPWFRTDSLIGYRELSSGEELVELADDEQAEDSWGRAHLALKDMIENGFASGIAGGGEDWNLDEMLGAVDCCLKLEEMRTLVGRLTKRSVTGLSKNGLIDALRKGLQGQKTLTQFFAVQKTAVNRGCQVAAEVVKVLAPKQFAESETNFFVMSKLSEDCVRLSRRIMRLVFLTSSGGFGASTSVLYPVLNPALLADFGKVQYAEYECKVEHSVFPSRRRFLLWEAGQELRCAWEAALASSYGQAPDMSSKSSPNALGESAGPFKQAVLAPVKAESVVAKCAASPDIIYISDTDEPGPDDRQRTKVLTNVEKFLVSAAREAAQLYVGASGVESLGIGRAGGVVDKEVNEGVVLVAAACLRSYLNERSSEADGGWYCDRDYLLQLDPGWSLCSIIWCGIDALERGRRYEDAASLLSLLLSTRFLRHKRAGMYNRLALDMQHMGDDAAALSICQEALKDDRVSGGDRVTITKRQERLESKMLKTKKKQVAPNEPCVVDKIDVDDFDMETPSDKKKRKELEREAKSAKKRSKAQGEEVPEINEHNSIGKGADAGTVGEEERRLLGLSSINEKSEVPPDDVIRGVRLGNKVVGRKSRFAGFDRHGQECLGGFLCNVEELCLQHYGVDGGGDWTGVHCEGGCFYTLYSLLFWEVIFASDVSDVFLTPFQDAPLDMHSYPHFYRNREKKITSTLSRLQKSDIFDLLEWVAKAWDDHFETVCRGLSWGAYTKKFLQAVAMCIGGKGLAGICRALSVNYKHFHGGLPDLLLLKARRRACGSDMWVNVDLDELVGGAGVKSRGFEAREEGDWEDLRAFHATNKATKPGRKLKNDPVEDAESTKVSEPAEEDDHLVDAIVQDGIFLEDGFEYSFQGKLVEVKGPNDFLMERQRLWLEILARAGIDARVCRVTEEEREELHV